MMKKLITLGCLLAATQSFAQSGSVGIGTINPKAQLHATGTVRFDTLKGTGVRPVYVNDSGNLVTGIAQVTTSNTPYAIPDANCTGVSSPITVTGMPTAVPSSNIQVKINITHLYPGDLFVYLISPTGQILNLAYHEDPNSGVANFTGTIFSDAATLSIAAGTGPFTSAYRPRGSLGTVGSAPAYIGGLAVIACTYAGTVSTFAGLGGGSIVPNGTWTLKVIDGYSTDAGTINNWSILFDGSGAFTASPIAANYVPKGTTAGLLINSSIYDNGNVGIGTTVPVVPLDVVSPNNLTGNTLTVRANNLTQGVGINYNTVSSIGTNPNVDLNLVSKGTGSVLLNPAGGNVGIGTSGANAPLQFSNAVANRKIVLYETANNNNQFFGFGINGSILRYQTDITSSDHVFYAGTGTATSNELMRVRGTGNVGIGASSPSELLQIGSSTGTAYTSPGLLLQSSANTDGQGGIIKFRETGGGYGINLRHNTNPNTAGTNIEGLFIEGYNNGTPSNIMTVDQNGLNVGIRTVKPLSTLDVQGTFSVGESGYPGGLAFSMRQDNGNNTYVGRISNFSNATSAQFAGSWGLRIDAGANAFGGYLVPMVGFHRPDGTIIGAIYQNSVNSVSYATTSDIRLKKDIRPSHYSLQDLLNIQVRDYKYIGDESAQTGFLAQQLYTVFPNAVSKGGEDAKTHPWMVDYGRLTPLIIKAMQDMNDKVEALEKENAALRAQAAQLEKLAQQVAELRQALGVLSKTSDAKPAGN